MKSLLFLTLILFTSSTFANKYLSYSRTDQSLLITTEKGQVRLTAYSPFAIETFYQWQGIKQLPSWSIAVKPQKVVAKLKEKANSLIFDTGYLKAVVTKQPFHIAYYKNNKLLVEENKGFYKTGTSIGFRFKLSHDEKLMGGGERVVGMDRRGLKLPLYNRAHYGYGTDAPQMNYSLPVVMSSKKYLILFDNSAKGSIDFAKTEKNILNFSAIGGRTSYIIFTADSYPDLIHHYVNITGKQPLPPRWALGNFASRFGYRTQKQAEATVERFIDEDIPLDAVVLDLYWFGKDIKGYLGDLEWDKKAFPHPEKMINLFKQKNIKTVIITEPFILTNSKKWQQAVEHDVLAKDKQGKVKEFDFYFGHTGLIDIFNKKADDWFWQFYQGLMQQGIEGWWGDLGEPEVHPQDMVHWISRVKMNATADEVHNVYGHKWSEMIYQHQLKNFPDKRIFLLMRSGFAGTQRYGILPWTGDVSRSWDGLKPQVELSLQMGILGLGYTHSDLGGFSNVKTFDKELYTRWLEYGVFQPIYRPHADEVFPSEPVFQDEETKNIIRKFIKLRYQLLPYNYTLAYENSISGMPLMRPLFFEDENNVNLIDNKESYLWGDSFLVTPVVDPGINLVKVHAPKGIWFDFWNDKSYSGGQTLNVPVSLKTIPVLVRAGAFIPMISGINNTENYSSKYLTLHYYTENSVVNSTGQMFEDDGKSNKSIENGEFELLKFKGVQSSHLFEFYFEKSGKGYAGEPLQRSINFILHHWLNTPGEIKFNHQKIKKVSTLKALNNTSKAYFYDAEKATLTIKFVWKKNKNHLLINKNNLENQHG